LAQRSRHDIEVMGLEDRAWRWRLRASAPWFADRIRQTDRPGLLVVSSLIDASVLRGLVGSEIPMVTYMHESQGVYPSGSGEWDLESATRNWQSMLAADEVWFNSAYHRATALEQVELLEAAMPPEQRISLVGLIRDKSAVVYPGVDLSWVQPRRPRDGPPVILWPHRWDRDKNADVFERALRRLKVAGLDFRLVLAGADSSPPSEVRTGVIKDLADQILAVGPFDVQVYRRWLLESDIVVSCTGHEFFGIAVVEALAAGCQPVLPNGFSYPELLAGQAELYEPGSFGSALGRAVRSFDASASSIDVRRFDWNERIGDYDSRMSELVSG
jgi:glycosyltransferase involved in cell wall biosynthesis